MQYQANCKMKSNEDQMYSIAGSAAAKDAVAGTCGLFPTIPSRVDSLKEDE
jgi:hypothetical protein